MKNLRNNGASAAHIVPNREPHGASPKLASPADEWRGDSISARQLWAQNRFWMETQNLASKRHGGRRQQHHRALLFAMKTFEWGLKCVGQYRRGVENARDITVRELDLALPGLPAHFDGFTILHISDPHLDGMPGLEFEVLRLLQHRRFDICALTGDYRNAIHGSIRATMQGLERLVHGIQTREGFVGVLGNHDDCHMVAPMEAMGIRVLINEAWVLERNGQMLQFVGTDDVHYYYTDQALLALERACRGFTIALVHSPELCDAAAEAGVSLYLCGHTHAGQVCLPGGIPLVKHLRSGRAYYRGHWQHRGMQGITSAGMGTSGIPVRFNTQGEVMILTLRRK